MTGRNVFPSLALLLPLLAAGPALAASIDHAVEMQACMTLAETRPDAALESAQVWQERGGGDRAQLCKALALFHKGDFKAAGARFEELAPRLGQNDPTVAAGLYGRAGWAWLRAGDQARAEKAYGEALKRKPDDVDLRIDRAFARAEAERYWDAVADLDAAIARDPRRADAFVYRAAARKALSQYREALNDVAHALELKPNDPETVLLRGNIKAAAGDLKGARDDWKLVRRLAPEGRPAKAAADNLARLDKAEAAGTYKAPEPKKP
jgi:tetratricopeptide (TPR) repeat protein